MDLTERIAKDSLPLTLVGLTGRAFGMMVPLIIARWFGADSASDAFYLALAAPMFVEALLASALHATLGPRYASALKESTRAAARFVGHSLLTFAVMLAGIAFLLLHLLPPAFVIVAGHQSAQTAELAASLLPWLLAALPLMGVNITLGSALELRGHFLIPAWLPIFKAMAYLAIAGLLKAELDVASLPLGYFGGELIQLVWLSYGFVSRGIQVSFDELRRPAITGTIAVFIPLALGDTAVHINAFVDRIMAASLLPGDLTALEYADRVRVIPEAIVSVGLLRVTFAHWSNSSVQGSSDSIRQSFGQVARWIVILMVPAATALTLLRLPVVSILFGGQAFGPEAVDATALTLVGYAPGVPFLMLGTLAINLLWIHRRLKVVLVVGFVSTVSNLALNLALIDSLGTQGLALATTLNQVLVAGLLLWAAHRSVGRLLRAQFWFWALGVGVLTALIGVLIEIYVGVPGMHWLEDLPRIVLIVGLFGGEIVGLAALGGHLRHLRGPHGPAQIEGQ